MRLTFLLLLFLIQPVKAEFTKCALNSNADGIINEVANGNAGRVADPENPILFQRNMTNIEHPAGIVQDLKLTQQKYNEYYDQVARGNITVDFHQKVQMHLRDQIGEGYTRALKPEEIAEIMRDGRTQAGQFFSKPQAAHVGHNGSAVYVRCIRDCDQYFEAASTGSGVQAVKPIPSENLEIVVPDYDAAFAAARNSNKAAEAAPPVGIVVEEIDDAAELMDAFRKFNQMSPSEIKSASLDDFIKNGRKFHEDLGVFDFDKSTVKKLAPGGRNNGGVMRVKTKDGDQMVVKVLKDRYGDNLPPNDVLREIRNAQLVHQMGIGPEAHLMKTKTGYNLVMRESPGVNIKEILDPKNAGTLNTQSNIEAILGVKTRDLNEARKLYARRVLEDKELLNEMKRIGNVLDQNGVDSIDLQIMIQPSTTGTPASAQVIDSAMFHMGKPNRSAENAYDIKEMISRLRQIANQ